MNKTLTILALSAVVGTASAQTLTALNSFGVNGWVAPAANTILGTASLERGLAVNKTNGNVYVATRTAGAPGSGVYVMNGTTGAVGSAFNMTGISGGTFAFSMIGVSDDGQIYLSNLTTNTTTSNFKIYYWGSEAAALGGPSTTAISYAGQAFRLGDTLDVMGSGTNVNVAAGYSGANGYALFSGGSTLTGADVAVPGSTNGDFRLGLTFGAANNDVYGKQTGGTAAAAPLRNFNNGVLTTSTLVSGGEMAMDYVSIGGINYLATLDANSSIVRVYNAANLAGGPLASLTTTTGTLTANGNAVGSIKFGNVTGSSVTIYAMSTNQGVQAMVFDTNPIPEPGTMIALGLGVAALAARRRRK